MSNVTQTNSSTGGIGFLGLLTLIFVVAKLAGTINWSWWLVFSPILAGVGLFFIILLVAIVVAVVIDK